MIGFMDFAGMNLGLHLLTISGKLIKTQFLFFLTLRKI